MRLYDADGLTKQFRSRSNCSFNNILICEKNNLICAYMPTVSLGLTVLIFIYLELIQNCTTFHRYPIFSTRYSVMCKVYTGYCGTSEIEHGLCACTVDNPLAKARGLSLRTGAQPMLYLPLSCLRYCICLKQSEVSLKNEYVISLKKSTACHILSAMLLNQ